MSKSKGLGDTVKKVIKITKIDKVLGKENCDKCDKRKEQLNKKFPYKT